MGEAGRSSRSWTASVASSAATSSFELAARRGWDMTHLLPEFRKRLPIGVQLDGELVALGLRRPPRLPPAQLENAAWPYRCRADLVRLRRARVEGLPTTVQPYSERRAILEQLDIENERVKLVATFEDGEALFAAVCERVWKAWSRSATATPRPA